MYKLLLILRYLRRKLAPMFAALAVTLCTAMVIIVISVMGGFLDMMRGAAKKLSGDVIVRADLTGFPHYEGMLAALLKTPEVAAATPILRTYGLINLDGKIMTVEIEGVVPPGLDSVTGFASTLYWTDYQKPGMEMKTPAEWGDKPGAVPGIAVSPYNRRDSKGQYDFRNSSVSGRMTLTVVPLSMQGGLIQPESKDFTVVNEFKSGLYDIDANRVYVPFAALQKMLHMNEAKKGNPETGEMTNEVVPARATEIMVRGKDGLPLAEVKRAVERAVQLYLNQHMDIPPLSVMTWQERHATFLGAVEKEKFLLTILFAIISIVAVAMIAVIFYMIVLEKTRDIGVLRALGASRNGIASIFLGYGLAIGVVGAILGFGLSALVVLNINEIQDKLTAWFGVTVWNPEVYYFDKIPSQLNPHEVTYILIAAVLSSVIGSLVPAFLASRLDPVESLRYE